jgi:hypothetical protein|mmetsp:Transcript_3704/g.5558  ORF Transcript_3704/g.5558 Transcript_3704/m.5558 type:complete len:203 (+) Transcript_3704:49-657(+)|eukprot:scaffold18245_cov132-Skeletonema_dohrnii-CCMP3373.AAC.1
MIRSRAIPTVLSRATGNGIHAVLLIDADGELLGSAGSPPPASLQNKGENNDSKIAWPLDAASIGALISEVAGDYRRLGDELLLLDPLYDSQRSNVSNDGSKDMSGSEEGMQSQQDGTPRDDGKQHSESSGGNQQGKDGKEKNGQGSNLKSLIIEMEYGVVGVASADQFYVIALADTTVQHGTLTGRLRSLGSHVGEALSQLD